MIDKVKNVSVKCSRKKLASSPEEHNMAKGKTGLDGRHEDINGRIDLKRSDALNKNLSHPIPEFSPNATVGYMRKVTGEQGLKAIAKDSSRRFRATFSAGSSRPVRAGGQPSLSTQTLVIR